MSERLKPSPEQAAAQKGIRRAETLILSLFKGMKLRGPTLLINFTGYVEEFGVAVTSNNSLFVIIFSSNRDTVSYFLAFCLGHL